MSHLLIKTEINGSLVFDSDKAELFINKCLSDILLFQPLTDILSLIDLSAFEEFLNFPISVLRFVKNCVPLRLC